MLIIFIYTLFVILGLIITGILGAIITYYVSEIKITKENECKNCKHRINKND